MLKYIVMLVIISWHTCSFSRKPCAPEVYPARGVTGTGSGTWACLLCPLQHHRSTLCCIPECRHLLTLQPKASSDDPNTYLDHTQLLTSLPCILNSSWVLFLGLFWIVGVSGAACPLLGRTQPTWAPCREGQWFHTLILCRPSQFRAGYSHTPVCPELVRADTSTDGSKKHGISRLLSSLPLVTDNMPNALPGNVVSWCLGWDAVYIPTLCSQRMLQHQGSG